MSSWEEFEKNCVKYLNEKFNEYAAFEHKGGADSTVPDILVKTKNGNCFYIDAKHSPAQCGQFVLLPDINTRQFVYSSSKSDINIYSRSIMEYMNKDFDSFREAGTKGKNIDMENGSDIFAKWIIQTYKEKNVEFFISNNYTIIPIDNIADYFDISAKYRIKRSGSDNVRANRIEIVKKYIESFNYSITNIRTAGDKLFVSSSQISHNQRFILDGYEFMFSKRGNEFEIRKLSNTYNANVIFSIRCKENIQGLSDRDFIYYLNK